MSEVKVGSWNALNAFGDESLSTSRMNDAIEVVKKLDVDVLAIQEMARRGATSPELESERLEEVTNRLEAEGYEGLIVDYGSGKDERNAHYLSLWSRVGRTELPDDGAVKRYGQRNGLQVFVPEIEANIIAVHSDDRYPQRRIESANALLSENATNQNEYIVMGDFNDMYRDDPKGRVLRALGKVVNRIEVGEYYDTSRRLQRLAGGVIRLCRMSGGNSLEVFSKAGYHDADQTRESTFHLGKFSWQLDHIIGSSKIEFTDFTVHSRHAKSSGRPLSDHSPITARAVRN